MKKSILNLAFALCPLLILAQCPECIPDETCAGINGPSICPEIVPDGTANEYYEEVITFHMPHNFTDPGTGADITLNEVIVTNIQGIPIGLEATLNSDDYTYYPNEGEEWGCVTICGVPLLPGVYEGTISILAFAEAFGIPVESNQQFILQMVVYEGDGTNNSFSYNVLTGCEEAVINFEGQIDASPQLTTWEWNFGNGNTSDVQFPPEQNFIGAGEYTVSLQTNIYNTEITEIDLNNLSSGWSGDIEELIEAFSDPDPYFTITDGLDFVVYTSTTVDNTTSNTWSGLSIPINNPPYSISFYDEDGISADDFLGTYEITAEPGLQNFNVNSGTSGFVEIDLVLDLEFYNEETVIIYENPNGLFDIDDVNNTLSYVDPSLVSFDWFLNDEILESENNAILEMNEWGVYYCQVTNEWGCSSTSESYTFCPDFNLTFDADDDILLAPIGFETYQWFLNGEIIEGEDSSQLTTSGIGTYYVQITTDYGCDVSSEEYLITSVHEFTSEMEISVYPNPNSGQFYIDFHTDQLGELVDLKLFDQMGRLVYNDSKIISETLFVTIDNQHASGEYLLILQMKSTTVRKRLFID